MSNGFKCFLMRSQMSLLHDYHYNNNHYFCGGVTISNFNHFSTAFPQSDFGCSSNVCTINNGRENIIKSF